MKKTPIVFLIILAIALAIYAILPKYVQKAILYTYPGIYDLKLFPYNTVENGTPQPYKYDKNYNKAVIDEALQRLCKPRSVFSGSGFHFQRRGSTPGVLTWQAFLYHNLLTIPLINSLIGDTKTTTSQHLLHLVVSKINRQRQSHRFYNITVLYSMR